jgi:hypothetical protein
MPSFSSSYRSLHTLTVPGLPFHDLVVKVLEVPQPAPSSGGGSSSNNAFHRVLVG